MTVRSEIVAALDTVTELGSRVYADTPPDGTPYPCVAVLVDVSSNPDLYGDAETQWWRMNGQVSLWQDVANEDTDLVASVRRALDGLKLVAGLRLRVTGVARVPDPDFPLVLHAFTLTTPVPR